MRVGGKVGSLALPADLLYLCLSGILRILFFYFEEELGKKTKVICCLEGRPYQFASSGKGGMELGACLDQRELAPLSVLETAERG